MDPYIRYSMTADGTRLPTAVTFAQTNSTHDVGMVRPRIKA